MSKRTLTARYFKLLQEEFDPDSITIRKALRVNTLRISEEDFVQRMSAKNVRLKKIPYLPHAFWYEADFPISSMTENLLGLFYIQEPASQIPPLVLIDATEREKIKKRIQNNETGVSDIHSVPSILDMAAAPGSKTTELVQLTEDKVPIVALDSVAPRISILNNNLDRMGYRSVVTYRKDARYADDLNMLFDYILLDAPCSGNFCIEKDFFTKRSVHDYHKQSVLQKELLRTAHNILKPGGVLVYSTCSLEPEEDEEVVDWFLSEYEDMEIEPIDFPLGDDGLTEVFDKQLNPLVSRAKRFWPHRTKTQGFFIAKFRKKINEK
jgi:NOL1/NOP2/sun family putative RNA methylase